MPLVVILLWGSSTVLSALSLHEIGPMAVAFWRWVWALPILWGVLLLSPERSNIVPILRGHFVALIAISISGIAALYALQNLALAHTSAFNVSLLIELTPIFIALLGIPLLHEYPSRKTWLGIGMGFLGAVFMAFSGASSALSSGQGHILGDVMALAAAFSGAIYTVHGKHLMQKMSPLMLTTHSATLGVLMLLPMALWEGRFWPQSWTVWGFLATLGIGAGAIGGLWWFSELEHRPAAQLGMILFVTALVAAGLSVIALGNPLTVWLVAGGALVLLGAHQVG